MESLEESSLLGLLHFPEMLDTSTAPLSARGESLARWQSVSMSKSVVLVHLICKNILTHFIVL